MESWDLLTNFIENQSSQHLSNPKQVYGMRLAGEEILSNMIREISESTETLEKHLIWISSQNLTEESKTWFELLIEDNGPQFDPHLEMPRDIQVSTPINERPIGGLGLFLVQQSVDQVNYEWANNRNRYRIRVAQQCP
jgi:serine/threonine-protein kinase RsbW